MGEIKSRIRALLKSNSGKNLITYLIFVIIASIFWLLLTLNTDIQRDINIAVNIKNQPDSITIINDIPETVKVTIKDKGSNLIKYSLGVKPSIDIDFKDFITSNDVFRVSTIDLKSLLTKNLISGGELIAISPDSLYSAYTSQPGKKVPLLLDLEISVNYKYVLSGRIKPNVDSIVVFASKEKLKTINSVSTSKITEKDLTDSTRMKVKLISHKGVRLQPSVVDIIIPVEPLINKHQTVIINQEGVPEGESIVTFPSKIEISYLVPSSLYKDVQDFCPYVRYSEANRRTSKLKVYIDEPWDFSDITITPDSVEYIIDKN